MLRAMKLSVLVLAMFVNPVVSSAAMLGPFAGSWDGTEPTQLGRIFRDATPSDGNAPKPFPGGFNAGSTFSYELFQFYNNGPADVVTIDATVSSVDTHFAAFSGTFYDTTFVNNGPTYLGDIGSSVSQSFSILAPVNSPFFVIAMTTASEDPLGQTFSFTVEGDNVSLSPPSSVPEPGTMTLVGLGAFGLIGGAIRRRRDSK